MIPLYKPFMPKLPQLDSILHSGQLAYGDYSKEFEELLRKYFNTENILVTNSFNMAISMCISLLDIHMGDEIIASPMGCLASTQPFVTHDIFVRWADIDPATGTLNPDDVRKKINKRTKAILHNHFCGYPGYIDEINNVAKKYGIPVINDGIECFGSEYKGKRISTQSDITIYSFNAVRIPNTVDGGAIIIGDDELYQKATLIRDCGIDRRMFRDELGEINPKCDIRLKGHSATMSNINGYIGVEQMKHVDSLICKQRDNARIWNQIMEHRIVGNKMMSLNGNPNFWVYGYLSKDKKKDISSFRDKGMFASGVHMDNSRYSLFGKQDVLNGVEEFYNRFVAVPCGWWVDRDDIR